jgi:hypothetical protein
MRQLCLFLFFGSIFFLIGCRVPEKESVVQPQGECITQFQEKEYTTVIPEKICPFTVEVYPETLYVGDPLYVRINFQNNTNMDAYATPLDYNDIDERMIEFYLKDSAGQIISWSIFEGGGWPGNNIYVWQKIQPGEKGLTQYMSLSFPGVRYTENTDVYCMRYDRKQWKEIRNSAYGAVGQLLVIINNRYPSPHYPHLPQTLINTSAKIVVKPRNPEEMKIIAETFLDHPDFEYCERHDLERIISKLIPGTLQNLLMYELLLIELMDFVKSQSEIEELEQQMLESLEKTEKFLKTLHDIERENLKRAFFNERYRVEERIRNNERLSKRLHEVFGNKSPLVSPLGD